MQKDTLYYDGACPLCRAEINKLRILTRGKLEFENIHDLEHAADLPDRQTLMSRLHLRTADGEWLTGLDANIRAWRHTPLRYLWCALGSWPLRPFSSRAYEFWLRRRQKTQSCNLNQGGDRR